MRRLRVGSWYPWKQFVPIVRPGWAAQLRGEGVLCRTEVRQVKRALSADEVHLFRNVLQENEIPLDEIASLTGEDLPAVLRQVDGQEPLNPRVRRMAVELLDGKLLDPMIRVIRILQVKGKTELADALADMVNRGLLD